MATLGTGTRVGYSANVSPQTFTEIPYILEVTVPGRERDRVESTVHGTTGDRTYIPGLSDVRDGELRLAADLSNAVHLELATLELSQATIWVRYEIPISENLATTNYYGIQHKARVAKWIVETPIDDLKTIDVAFQHSESMFRQNSLPTEF